jgi:hypothetical protein
LSCSCSTQFLDYSHLVLGRMPNIYVLPFADPRRRASVPGLMAKSPSRRLTML